MTTENNSYFLGTHEDELKRLEFQSLAWKNVTEELWRFAGISEGQTVLDLGCGPGFCTLALSKIVGPKGRVFAIDKSSAFLETLKEHLEKDKINNVDVLELDIDKETLPINGVDVVFVRWLHQYVDQLAHVIAEEVRCLKQGGLIANMEVFHYEGVSMSPPQRSFKYVTQKIIEYYQKNGRDISVGGKVPSILAGHGMKIRSLTSACILAQAHEPLWEWYRQFSLSMVKRLVNEGVMAANEGEEFYKIWSDLKEVPGAFISTPSHMRVVAQKV